MKSYPSITRLSQATEREFYVFDKIDGSNIRYEWSRKTGWYKFGSRTQLLDESHPILGAAIPLFMETLAEPLAKVAYDNRWINVVAFAEFWGSKSLAGRHEVDDKKFLTLFDVSIYKRGIIGPQDFLNNFGHLNVPNFFGVRKWDAKFVESVKNSTLDGISFEGCVGKSVEYGKLNLVKCKTDNWLNAIHQRYTEDEANKLINS